MKITILGCGSSGGVPLIGCDCQVCTSSIAQNKRSRSSILVNKNKANLLIDSSPDLRSQALLNNIKNIDAVLYTHEHSDHISGIDDLRSFNYLANKPLDIYATKTVLAELKQRFPYVFIPNKPGMGWYKPQLTPYELDYYQEYNIGSFNIKIFKQIHGHEEVVGYKIDQFAYSTDLNQIPEESWPYLENLKLWVVDCLSYTASFGHAHLDLVLSWIERAKPQQAILTHMGHEIDYQQLSKQLPSNISLAYDGMTIDV